MHKFFLLILCCAIPYCRPAPGPGEEVARVNGKPIYKNEFLETLELLKWKLPWQEILGEKEKTAFKKEILDEMIRDRLLLAQPEMQTMDVTQEELEMDLRQLESRFPGGNIPPALRKKRLETLKIQNFIQKFSMEYHPSPEEVEDYYRENRKEFDEPEQVRCRHLLTDSYTKTLKLRERIVAGEKFEALARQFSLSPDRKKGGDLGFFPKGTMPHEFDLACFQLKVGELSPVMHSSFGFHLFQVLGQKEAKKPSLEEARPEIEKKLKLERGRQGFEKWLEAVKNQAQIEVRQEVLASIQPEIKKANHLDEPAH